jgi:hypothetical protein
MLFPLTNGEMTSSHLWGMLMNIVVELHTLALT